KGCAKLGVEAVMADHWAEGGKGAADVARAVVKIVESGKAKLKLLCPDDMPLLEKIKTIAREIYRAKEVADDQTARDRLANFDADTTVFDSSACLLYLAEKTGKFVPAKTDRARGELLSWMFFVSSGVGPYSGQSVHFRNYAPEKIPYALNRYAFEAQRHFGII